MVKRAIKEAAESASEAVEQSKVLCPWLPDPEPCPHCKRHMDATEEYVDQQAMVVPIWRCPECEYRAYRHRD